jgi:HEAT repeat protein
MSLLLGLAALPVGVFFNQLLGPALAVLGVLFGALGMFLTILRWHAWGFGVSLAASAVCCSTLCAVILFFGKPLPFSDRPTQEEAKSGTGAKTPSTRWFGDVGSNKREDDSPGADKEKPSTRNSAPPEPVKGSGNAKVDKLVQGLKSKQVADRVRAAEEIGRMKEEGKPAARALCEAAISSDEVVRQAALEALEKIHPSLYKPVSTLLLDNSPNNRQQAAQTIKLMGQEGNAATPVVLEILKRNNHEGPKGPFFIDDSFMLEEMATLQAIAPDELDTVNLMIELTTYEGYFSGGQVRHVAAIALGELAKKHPGKRQEIIKALLAATQFHPPRWQQLDQPTCIAAIGALGKIGPDAKEAIADLKKLKLSPDMAIREAAGAALEKIDPRP